MNDASIATAPYLPRPGVSKGSDSSVRPAVAKEQTFLCPMNPSELCRLEEAGYQWTESGYFLPEAPVMSST